MGVVSLSLSEQKYALELLLGLIQDYNLTIEDVSRGLEVTPYYVRCLINGKRRFSVKMKENVERLEKIYAKRFSLDCLVDFVHVSFKTLDWEMLCKDVLQIEPHLFMQKHTSLFNYGYSYSFDSIKILKARDDEKFQNMGCLILLSGKGCRQLERFFSTQNRTWFDFFKDCFRAGGKFTRLDLAVDDYIEYISLPELVGKIERNELETTFRTIEPKYTLLYDKDTGERTRQGVTVYFGSRQSPLIFCLYQKNYQLAKRYNKQVTDFDVKNRYEIRFMAKYADDAVRTILEKEDIYSVTLGVLFQKITVLEKGKQEIWSKWQRLMIGIDKVKLVTQPALMNYERLLRYAKDGFGRALKTLLEIDVINGTHSLQNILNDLDLTDKYREIIEVSKTDMSEMNGDYIDGEQLYVDGNEVNLLQAMLDDYLVEDETVEMSI